MCDPLVGLGLAMSVGGGLLGGMQKSAYDGALRQADMEAYQISRDARLAEQERQGEYEQQANDFWTNTANMLSTDQMALDEAAAQTSFQDTLDQLPEGAPQGFLLSGQDQASDEIKGEIAKRTSEAAAEARARVQALAKLSGQDTAGANRALALNDGTDFLSTLNGLRRGSLGVSQFEQSIPAKYVEPPNMLFADLLSGAGGTLVGAKMPGGMLY